MIASNIKALINKLKLCKLEGLGKRAQRKLIVRMLVEEAAIIWLLNLRKEMQWTKVNLLKLEYHNSNNNKETLIAKLRSCKRQKLNLNNKTNKIYLRILKMKMKV